MGYLSWLSYGKGFEVSILVVVILKYIKRCFIINISKSDYFVEYKIKLFLNLLYGIKYMNFVVILFF